MLATYHFLITPKILSNYTRKPVVLAGENAELHDAPSLLLGTVCIFKRSCVTEYQASSLVVWHTKQPPVSSPLPAIIVV